jgi:3-oxoacyl-[acyl-carrier protein] reductase
MPALDGRRAIVTGASTGLGAAIAEELAACGARVLLCSRSAEKLSAAVARISARVAPPGERSGRADPGQALLTLAADVLDPRTAPRLSALARDHWGGLDILVCNAGGPPPADFDEADDAAWEEAFRLVLLSPIRLIRACLPLLRASGMGRIILMNSVSALRPVRRLLLSNALRPGLIGLARHLGGELAADGILVNAISPGFFDTGRAREVQEAIARKSGRPLVEIQDETRARIPLGRQGDPRELGRLITFLASVENSYITGQAIVIDGGLTTAPE